MDGARGERDFTCLKGGQGSHFYSCFGLLISLSIQTLHILFLFSKNCQGIPVQDFFTFLRGLLRDCSSFSTFLGSRPKILLSVTALFLLKYNTMLLGVAVEDTIHHFLGSYVRGGSSYSYERLVREIYEDIADHWHQANHFSSPTTQSLLQTALFFSVFAVGTCSTSSEDEILGERISLSLQRSIG